MNKTSGYKDLEYKNFVENIRDLPFKNKSAQEQYKEVYNFIQNQSSQSKEDTYTFAKRYLSNTNYKYKDIEFYVPLLLGWAIGNIIKTSLLLTAVIVAIGFVVMYIDEKDKMITRNIENDEIILTVLEDYCKEVEQEFRKPSKSCKRIHVIKSSKNNS